MSQLDYYDLPTLVAVERESNPRNPAETRPALTILPGMLVRHKDWPQSLGVAMSRCWLDDDKPMQVLVLWTHAPGLFNLPNVRRVQPQLISQQLTSIQPMTAPSGLIFYLDYTYGSGSV